MDQKERGTSESGDLVQAAMRPGVKLVLCLDEISNLTMREWEILAHLAAGKAPKEIREELKVSKSTLCKHLRAVRNTLGARNNREVVRRAKERGYIA